MKFLVNVDRKEALTKGMNKYGECVVEMDPATIPSDLRSLLPCFSEKSDRCVTVAQVDLSNGVFPFDIFGVLRHVRLDITADSPSSEGVIEVLMAYQASYKIHADEEAAKFAKLLDAIKEVGDDFPEDKNPWQELVWQFYNSSYGNEWLKEHPLIEPHFERIHGIIQARAAAAKARAEEDAKQRRQKAEQEEAAKKAAEEAGKTSLKAWAYAYGTDLLKARIEGGFAWVDLALQEYADHVFSGVTIPDGWSADGAADETLNDCESVKQSPALTPGLAEMNLLKQVRKQLQGKGTAELAQLKYIMQNAGSDNDDEGVVIRNEVEVTITWTAWPGCREIKRYIYPTTK